MSYALFLDDIREPKQVKWVDLPPYDWTIVRNYKEFTRTIEARGLPYFIAFDHDLSLEHYVHNTVVTDSKEKTGSDCALWLIDYCIKHDKDVPKFVVHSMNPAGVISIKSKLTNYTNERAKQTKSNTQAS